MELLLVIGLLGVAGLLMTRLIGASMRVVRTAPQAQEQHQAVDRMTFTLRRDVWGAREIVVSDARSIDLTQSDDSHIRWQIKDDLAVRTSPSGEQSWKISLPIRAEQQGPSLVLRTESNRDALNDEQRFLSQIMLAAEEKR
jgi:hypothetical protein